MKYHIYNNWDSFINDVLKILPNFKPGDVDAFNAKKSKYIYFRYSPPTELFNWCYVNKRCEDCHSCDIKEHLTYLREEKLKRILW